MQPVHYFSTRGDDERLTSSQAILQGLAGDGGLYVPDTIPAIDRPLGELVSLSYQDLAYDILKLFLTDYTEEELRACIRGAYDEKFDTPAIAPVTEQGGYFFLELFHGRTLAFKDMALSILPHLMKTAAKKNGLKKKIMILTATSGDTGKAALEGFSGVDGTGVVVFYPLNGVSTVQERQMLTQEGCNVHVASVRGNFDDTQTGVKEIFSDKAFAMEMDGKNIMLSSANSINIGRLVPQVVYYFYAYGRLVTEGKIKTGEKVNFTVPTGNFGNILAGYYAKRMGLPIHTLICASNANKVLYDFFRTRLYDRNREFFLTVSPSMDILVSSNLERLLYHASKDCRTVRECMNGLSAAGRYEFSIPVPDIAVQWASEDETLAAIREMYQNGYMMDTHTAVAWAAYQKYRADSEDDTKNMIVSTASPFKFSEAVTAAVEKPSDGSRRDAFRLLDDLARLTHMEVPCQIAGLENKEIRHHTVCEKDGMKQTVRQFAERL